MKGITTIGWWPKPAWRVPILLFIFTVFFYWKILFTARYMFPWDAWDFFYPYLAFVHEELRHFRLPLWNPYVMSGFPIIGDPEAQIFYPLNWLMVLLHPLSPLPYKLVEVVEIIHFFLAGLFMYWLAKDFTKDDLPAMLGGVLFMSSGAMVAHTEHLATIEAMAWYPLVFLLARRGLLEKNYRWSALAGLFMGMETLVGHLQHAVYLGLLLFLYFLYEACAGPHRRRLWPHWIAHLFAVGAIGACLALIQIVPTSQLGPQSIRTYLTYWDVTAGSDLRVFWTLFLPNVFGGLMKIPYHGPGDPSFSYVFLTVPGCLLALVGIVARVRRKDLFWLALIFLSIELSLGRRGFLGTVVYRIPVLNLFRQMSVFFDLGNFALCLMAAVGAGELLDRDSRNYYRRWFSAAVIGVLVVATGLGLRYQAADKVHGWNHMLVGLTLSAVLVAAWLHGWIHSRIAASAMLLLMTFELCYYSRDKRFNLDSNDPATNLAYNYASHHSESLEFLRSDRATDFRVAGFDGSPWDSNGSNVWRLPGIFGWNPVMLRDYQDTIRQVLHVNDYAQPYGGTDHTIESPLIDLFGVKYLLVNDASEEEMRLAESRKFAKVFAEPTRRKIYRNKEFISRAWFYPQAYVLRDRAAVLAMLNSHWFDARRTLLFAAPELPGSMTSQAEYVEVITLPADKVSAASAGHSENDPDCATARPAYKYWDGTGNWIRFDIDGGLEPGRYAFLAEYVSATPTPPIVVTEVVQEGRRQSSDALVLPRTAGWVCKSTRSAELGEFELAAGAAKITIIHRRDPAVDLFALRLVRLPPAPPAADEGRDFSFRDFDVAANTYTFTADLKRDGFVLLNEIYCPGWEAAVDGRPADILPADYAFRALAVSAGSHRIVMRFRPPHLRLAGTISLLTLVGLLGYLIPRRRNKNRA